MTLAAHQQQPESESYDLWYAGAFSALFCAYLIVLLATSDHGLWWAATGAAANIAPPALLGLGARRALPLLQRAPPIQRLAAFAVGAVVFSLAWYVLLAFALGAARVLQGDTFELVFLAGPGRVWQIYQGLLVFALLLCATALYGASKAAPTQHARARADTILVRGEEGLVPIALAELLAIEADDDASYVVTRTSRFRTRNTLANWAEQLDSADFVRVHRSWIVNLKFVLAVEPVGGGRMTAHLPGGVSVPVSRSGARSLRERST